jgi:hypothetical protein
VIRALLLVPLLAGCAASYHRPNHPAFDAYEDALTVKYTEGTVPPEAWGTKDGRNQTIDEMLFLADAAYAEYEVGLYENNATFNTVTDILTMGLAAGGAVATNGAAQILSAAVAGVTGVRSTVEKNFFLEQTRFSLILRMDAQRLRVRTLIEERKAESLSRYTFSEALLDVQAYYQAGTLMAALKASSADAVQGLQSATMRFQAVKSATRRLEGSDQ